MTIARRSLVALVALAGLALAVGGAWFAVVLGPSGTVRFSASATGPLVVGPQVLARIDAAVTVTATSPDGPVFIGAATPQDVLDVVGGSRVQQAVAARFPARTLALQASGSGSLADPRALEVWRGVGTGSLDLQTADAPESVLVVPTTTAPVRVTVELRRGAWFAEAIVGLVVGLILTAAAATWLSRQLGYRIPVRSLPLSARGAGRGAPLRQSGPTVPQRFDEDDEVDPAQEAPGTDSTDSIDSTDGSGTDSSVPTEPGREVRS